MGDARPIGPRRGRQPGFEDPWHSSPEGGPSYADRHHHRRSRGDPGQRAGVAAHRAAAEAGPVGRGALPAARRPAERQPPERGRHVPRVLLRDPAPLGRDPDRVRELRPHGAGMMDEDHKTSEDRLREYLRVWISVQRQHLHELAQFLDGDPETAPPIGDEPQRPSPEGLHAQKLREDMLLEAAEQMRAVLGGVHDYGHDSDSVKDTQRVIEAMDAWDKAAR